jgi:hypothetical protein
MTAKLLALLAAVLGDKTAADIKTLIHQRCRPLEQEKMH